MVWDGKPGTNDRRYPTDRLGTSGNPAGGVGSSGWGYRSLEEEEEEGFFSYPSLLGCQGQSTGPDISHDSPQDRGAHSVYHQDPQNAFSCLVS